MLDVSRRELKYLVQETEMVRIRHQLQAVMKADPHNQGKGYLVRSLYFDSLKDRDFEEKADGYDNRQKLRIRVYDPHSDRAKLELKEKIGNAQRKRSLSISRDEAERMIAGEYSFLLSREEPIASVLYTMLTLEVYRPKCIVEYDRLAFCRDTNNIRVTFDRHLRATEANFDLFRDTLTLYPVTSPTESTMEVKYSGFMLTYIKNALQSADKVQVSNSKYCLARRVSKRGRR